MDLMQFRGVVPNGYAGIGAYIGFGGILMILGGLGEFLLGNTFPCVVFGSFGAFWITLAITLIPYFGAASSYTDGGALGAGFNNSFGFFLVSMGVLCLIYAICALRTNLILFLILILLVPAFSCLTAGYFLLALKEEAVALNLIIAGGALAFVICMLGWYIFAAILLASVDFPISLPGKIFCLHHRDIVSDIFQCSISPTSSRAPATRRTTRLLKCIGASWACYVL